MNLAASLDALVPIREYVRQAAQQAGIGPAATYRLCLAVDELATNIITHGYKDKTVESTLGIEATISASDLTIILEDWAEEYDPRQYVIPDLTLPLEQKPVGKLGIHLAISGVDKFFYERSGERNINILKVMRPN